MNTARRPHRQVDKNSKGVVYLRYDSVESASKCVGALSGRWFAGKQIAAEYLPADAYDGLEL